MRATSLVLVAAMLLPAPTLAGGAKGSSAVVSDAALTVTRTYSGTAASTPVVALEIFNPGDEIGGSDYQNEAHLKIRAGTNADHRRYIDYVGADGVTDWIQGVNATNTYVLFDANDTVHRMWFLTTATGGGHSVIASASTGAVQINNDGGGTHAGTGGLEVWSGGETPTKVWSVTAAGAVIHESGGSANHAVCWKPDGKTLGYCSAVVASDGTCGTCN